MNRVRISQSILFYVVAITIFFPAKGLISFFIWIGLGYDISQYSGLVYTIIMALFILPVLIYKGYIKNTYESLFFVTVAFLGLSIALLNKDNLLLHYTFVLFGLPLIMSWIREVDDSVITHLLSTFFKLTIIFIIIEMFVIQFDLLGKISYDEILTYQSSFTSKIELNSIFDTRSSSGMYRTGGYLGNLLAMPSLILLSFIFFYVNWNICSSYQNAFWAILGGTALLASVSITAIIAGVISVIFYEIFVRRRVLIIVGLCVLATYILYFGIPVVEYSIIRFIDNISNSDYLYKFIGFDAPLIDILRYVVIGGWRTGLVGIPSHVDFINLIFIFGIFPAFFVISRWYRAIKFGLNISCSSSAHVYALMLLSLTLTFSHHHMGMTIYSMILATIMLLRIEEIKRATND